MEGVITEHDEQAAEEIYTTWVSIDITDIAQIITKAREKACKECAAKRQKSSPLIGKLQSGQKVSIKLYNGKVLRGATRCIKNYGPNGSTGFSFPPFTDVGTTFIFDREVEEVFEN